MPSTRNSRRGDLGVRQTRTDQSQYFALPRTQARRLAPSPPRPGHPAATSPCTQLGDHPLRDLRRQVRGAVGDSLQSGDQLARVARLQQEPTRTVTQRPRDVGVLGERRQHHDRRLRNTSAGSRRRPPGRPSAASGCPVRRRPADAAVRASIASSPSAASATTSMASSVAEDRPYAGANHRLVVGQQNPDHRVLSGVGETEPVCTIVLVHQHAPGETQPVDIGDRERLGGPVVPAAPITWRGDSSPIGGSIISIAGSALRRRSRIGRA